jgi:TonB family protein
LHARRIAGATGLHPQEIPTLPDYDELPANTVANGTVVLDVTIRKSGQVARVRTARSVADLTPSAINAVKSWSYNPATVNGTPNASRMVVAFVFQQNLS